MEKASVHTASRFYMTLPQYVRVKKPFHILKHNPARSEFHVSQEGHQVHEGSRPVVLTIQLMSSFCRCILSVKQKKMQKQQLHYNHNFNISFSKSTLFIKFTRPQYLDRKFILEGYNAIYYSFSDNSTRMLKQYE